MKRYIALVAGMSVGLLVAGMAANAEEGAAAVSTNQAAAVVVKAQTTCPVMAGSPINKKIFTDYNGKRVYFCCNACPRMFKKNPEKYMKIMQDAGVTPEDAPKADVAPAPLAK